MVASRSAPTASVLREAVDYKAVFERAPEPLAVVRVLADKVVVLAANARWREALEVKNPEVAGKPLSEVFAPEASAALDRAARRASYTGLPAQTTLRSAERGPSGEFLAHVLEKAVPARLVLMSVAPHAPQAAQRSLVTLDELEALGEGLAFIVDLTRRRTRYLAPALARRIGHPPEADLDLAGARRLVHASDFEAVAACVMGLGPLTGAGVSSATVRVRRPAGGWLRLQLRCLPLATDRRGKARAVLGMAVDITERWALSRDLGRAARAVERAGEAERRRLARNLHDSAAQHLVALDLSLSSLGRQPPGSEAAGALLDDMRASVAALHREIRTFSYLLHPPQLKRLGLAPALARFVEAFDRRSELKAEMEVQGEAQPLPPDLELALYRVAQEAVMNVHRHARAERLRVRLIQSPQSVTLEVEDDGVGLPDADPALRLGEDGVGIAGMQARLAQLGGALELVRLSQGLRVRATAPLKG
jgi:signal transduction histidine kinase